MKWFLIVLTILVLLTETNSKKSEDVDTLKLLHIVFRHGQRKLDIYSTPLKLSSPIIQGSLTKKGKKNSCETGKWLQERYGHFLGSYAKNLVQTANTYFERTRTTLKFVMEGLFSSKNFSCTGTFNSKNKFTFGELPLNNTVFVMPHPVCKNFATFYEEFQNTETYRNILAKYTVVKDYVEENLNITFTSLTEFLTIYDTYSMQKEASTAIPSWVEKVLPDLRSIMLDFFETTVATKELKSVAIGGFVKHLVESSSLKFKNLLQPQKRKLYMYSGHDSNVFWILQIFNYVVKIRPNYNSCVVIEAHTIDGIDGFKVFYKNGMEDDVHAISIPGCGFFCPLLIFKKLYENKFLSFDAC